MTDPVPPSTPFEPEFVTNLIALFEERIPFNGLLGLRVDSVCATGATGHLAMRPELVGSFAHQRLHGGVISAALDAMAGVAIMAAVAARHMDEVPAERMRRFGKLGTIDLRVDYLRSAIGERFVVESEVLRLGSRVATARMAFRDDAGKLLATGSAAYIVS